MYHTFLDRYLHSHSLIHRLDPRLKLLAALGFVVATSSAAPGAWPAYLLLAGLAVATIAAARIPSLEIVKRSMIALPFAGMVAASVPFTQGGQVVWAWHLFGWNLSVTDEGLILFASVMAKAWLSVIVTTLLLATTSLLDLLKAMRALHIPAVLTATMSFMVRYLHVLAEEAARLSIAREARSAGSGGSLIWRTKVLGRMIGTLFLRSYERSERIYAAMLSRGFAGEIRSLAVLDWRARDSWAALAWGAALAAILTFSHLLLWARSL